MIAMAGLSGCSTISVQTDYDNTVDFSKYRSFDFMQSGSTYQTNQVGGISPFVFQRAMQTTEEFLIGKGYTKNTTDPDIQIVYHIGTQDKVNVTSWGYGYGRWGGGVDVYEYTKGTLIIDFVDNETDDLFWRGAATATVDDTAGANQSKIDAAIQKILSKYPPQ
jgi:hypothetical protein